MVSQSWTKGSAQACVDVAKCLYKRVLGFINHLHLAGWRLDLVDHLFLSPVYVISGPKAINVYMRAMVVGSGS